MLSLLFGHDPQLDQLGSVVEDTFFCVSVDHPQLFHSSAVVDLELLAQEVQSSHRRTMTALLNPFCVNRIGWNLIPERLVLDSKNAEKLVRSQTKA